MRLFSLLLVSFVFLTGCAIRQEVHKTTEVELGGVFTVSVGLNSQGKAINSAEAVISFPTDVVEVQSLSTGGSVFSIWVEV
jgi:PBP1b-binding outer membrane lipoprotein LpoB